MYRYDWVIDQALHLVLKGVREGHLKKSFLFDLIKYYEKNYKIDLSHFKGQRDG